MTQEEFNKTKWYKGMHCYSIFDINNSRKLEVAGVDFMNGVIVTREKSRIDSPQSHSHYSEIKLERMVADPFMERAKADPFMERANFSDHEDARLLRKKFLQTFSGDEDT